MIRPDNLQYIPVRETKGVVTAFDRYDLRDDFAYKMRGFLNTERGYLGKRDYGTQQRYTLLPCKPNTGKAIVSVADNGSGLIRLEVTGHGRATGDIIIVHDMAGSGAATSNGIWTVTINGPNHLDLQNSTYSGALVYTVTNAKVRVPISLRRGATFFDKDTNSEHEIVVGVDENNKTRIYVWDGTVWQEQTRKLLCKINGAPVAPANTTTQQVITIDTITEEDGTVYTPANDELIGYLVYNSTRGTLSIVTDNTAVTLTMPHDVTVIPHTWANDNDLVLFRCTGIYDGFNFLNGTDPHIRMLPIEAQKKCNICYADNSGVALVRQDPVQVAKHTASRAMFPAFTDAVVATAVITGFTAPNPGDTIEVGGFPLEAVAAGPVYGQFLIGGVDGTAMNFVNAVNSDGYLSTIVQAVWESGDQVRLNAVTPGAAGNAITIAVTGGVFALTTGGPTLVNGADAVNSARLTLPTGFYTEKAFATTGFQAIGTIAAPKTGVSADESVTVGDGIQVSVAFSEVGSSLGYTHMRIYVVPLYRGNQVGQPICQIVVSGSIAANFPTPVVTVKVDPASVNKHLEGFNLYFAVQTTGAPTQADWTEDPSEYLLWQTRNVSGEYDWAYNNATQYCFSASFAQLFEGSYGAMESQGRESIYERLNYAPQTVRSPLQPLFMVQATRSQSAIILVDQSDDILRLSNYNGDGVHETESFPDVAFSKPGPDGSVAKMKLLLTIRGELLGIAIVNARAVALKATQIQLRHLDSGEDKVFEADVYAKDSILSHDYGLSWSGYRGAYMIPVGSLEIMPLFTDIKNLFDGSLLIDDKSASYITDAYRKAVICGWDPTFDRIWFHVQVNKDAARGGGSEYLNLCLTMDKSTLSTNFSVRELNIGSDRQPVRYFGRSQDGLMTIGYAKGILKYPILNGSLRYQDDVRSDGVTAGRGIPTSTLIHVGSVANLTNHKTLYSLIIGHFGRSVNKMGYVTVNVYVDDLVLIDTKYFRIDDAPEVLYIEPIGGVKRLWVEVLLPDESLTNFQELDLSELSLGLVPASTAA